MPFKSKAQQRFMFAAEERGEIPKGTAKRWAKHTPNIKKLPERKKKASDIAAAVLSKVADSEDNPWLRSILLGSLLGAGAGLFVYFSNYIVSKVEHAVKIAARDVKQKSHIRRNTASVPDMSYRGGQFNVSHSFPANRRTGD